VSFTTITLSVTSRRVFIIIVVYFLIDSVRKVLDTPSYSIIKWILVYLMLFLHRNEIF
jgi:uncharacterized membrane protein